MKHSIVISDFFPLRTVLLALSYPFCSLLLFNVKWFSLNISISRVWLWGSTLFHYIFIDSPIFSTFCKAHLQNFVQSHKAPLWIFCELSIWFNESEVTTFSEEGKVKRFWSMLWILLIIASLLSRHSNSWYHLFENIGQASVHWL